MCQTKSDLRSDFLPILPNDSKVFGRELPESDQVDGMVEQTSVGIPDVENHQKARTLVEKRAALPRFGIKSHVVDHSEHEALLGNEFTSLRHFQRGRLELYSRIDEVRLRTAIGLVSEVVAFDDISKVAFPVERVRLGRKGLEYIPQGSTDKALGKTKNRFL